jgi:hypothetical protein
LAHRWWLWRRLRRRQPRRRTTRCWRGSRNASRGAQAHRPYLRKAHTRTQTVRVPLTARAAQAFTRGRRHRTERRRLGKLYRQFIGRRRHTATHGHLQPFDCKRTSLSIRGALDRDLRLRNEVGRVTSDFPKSGPQLKAPRPRPPGGRDARRTTRRAAPHDPTLPVSRASAPAARSRCHRVAAALLASRDALRRRDSHPDARSRALARRAALRARRRAMQGGLQAGPSRVTWQSPNANRS